MNKQSDMQLSALLFHSLYENNHAVMLLIDWDTGNIFDGNPAACEFYGYTREQLKKMRITQINTLSQAEVFTEMNRAREKQKNHFLFKHRLASGEIRNVEVYSGSVQINQKEYLYSIVFDITDRVYLEEERNKLSTALAHIPNGVVIVSQDRRIEYVNPSFEQLIGFQASELIDQPIAMIFRDEEFMPQFNDLEETVHRGQIWRGEMRNKRKDGSEYWQHICASPVWDNQGQISSFVAVLEDITIQKNLELQRAQDEALAGHVQSMLAPLDQQIPGLVEIIGLSLPSRVVSGDYYDIIPLADQCFALVICDVMGKGMKSALHMVMARSITRTLIRDKSDPAQVVRQINRFLYPDLKPSDSFLTLWLGLLNPVERTLTYVNAGHNFPLLFREDGILPLSGKGVAIGLRRDTPYSSHQFQLNPNDLLFLYTDGVTEATNLSGQQFGQNSLSQLVQAHLHSSPRTIMDQLFLAIHRFTDGSEIRDDMTTLFVKIQGETPK